MDYEILYPGLNAMLKVKIKPGDVVRAEAGAMVAKSKDIKLEGALVGGLARSIRRTIFGREPLFFQHFTAEGSVGEVLIAPGVPGDIQMLDMLDGQDYFLQAGAFLASSGDITIDTALQHLSQGLFSGEGVFVLHATGQGTLAVSAFGAVYQITVPVGSKFTVGCGHLVAWSGDTTYGIRKASRGWVSSLMSGETFVCDFEGPGTVWLQTRSPEAFGAWIREFVPRRG